MENKKPGPFDVDASKQRALARTQEIQSFAPSLLAARVTTPELAEWAATTAKQVRDFKKQLEAERDSIAKPLRALAKQHTALWKPRIDAVNEVYKHLTGQISEFRQRQAAAQAAALREAKTAEEVTQAVAVLTPKPEGLVERTYYSVEIVDPSKVPAAYWQIDVDQLNREAREQKDAFHVPGVKLVRTVKAVPR